MIKKAPVQNLVCYLFKEEIKTFNDLFKKVDGKSLKKNFKRINKLDSIDFEIEGYLQNKHAAPPKWLKELSTIFRFDNSIQNISNSFVFFLKVENRIFAYTMGYSHHSLDKSKIEYDFGLKVTLNEIDHSNIRGIDVRKLTQTSHQKREISSANSVLKDFEFDHNEEFINALAGKAIDKTIANSLIGKEALKLSVELDLTNIYEYSKRLLKSYQKIDYKEKFDFIDNLKPIKDPTILAIMKQKAKLLFEDSKKASIILSYPNIDDFGFSKYKITYLNKSCEYEDINTEIIFQFIEEQKIELSKIDLEKFSISLLYDNCEPQIYDIWDYLVFEFTDNNKTYLYTANQLLEINPNYYNKLVSEISHYEIQSIQNLNILSFSHKNEGEYNEDFADKNSSVCVCLDKDNFRDFPNRPNDQVEVCDLITSNKEFICVKIYKKSSAPLSHLFMQGIVSAELLVEVKEYREKINSSVQWSDFIDANILNRNEITYVYAIVMEKNGTLSDNLPFFSKISLRQSIKALEKMGFKVNILKINYT